MFRVVLGVLVVAAEAVVPTGRELHQHAIGVDQVPEVQAGGGGRGGSSAFAAIRASISLAGRSASPSGSPNEWRDVLPPAGPPYSVTRSNASESSESIRSRNGSVFGPANVEPNVQNPLCGSERCSSRSNPPGACASTWVYSSLRVDLGIQQPARRPGYTAACASTWVYSSLRVDLGIQQPARRPGYTADRCRRRTPETPRRS